MYDNEFQLLAYWGVTLIMALYVKTALLNFNHFTIGSQLNSLTISADGVLTAACNIIRAARFWSLDYSVNVW